MPALNAIAPARTRSRILLFLQPALFFLIHSAQLSAPFSPSLRLLPPDHPPTLSLHPSSALRPRYINGKPFSGSHFKVLRGAGGRLGRDRSSLRSFIFITLYAFVCRAQATSLFRFATEGFSLPAPSAECFILLFYLCLLRGSLARGLSTGNSPPPPLARTRCAFNSSIKKTLVALQMFSAL